MKTAVWLCAIAVSISGYSQNSIDSLRELLKSESTSFSAKEMKSITSNLAYNYLVIQEFDSARKYYHKCLSSLPKNYDPELEGNVRMALGVIHSSKGLYDSSILYYNSASKIFQELHDSTNVSTVESNLSIIYKNQGLYEESVRSAIYAVSILENKMPSFVLASCYNTLATVNLKIKDFIKSEFYYRKGLYVRTKLKDSVEIAKAYNNIGEMFITTKQYDSAESNLKRAAVLKRQLSDSRGFTRTLSNLGKVAVLRGDLTIATTRLGEALELERKLDDPIGLIETLNNLGELNVITGNLSYASTLLQESRELIHLAGTPDYLRQNLELQIKLDGQKGDYAGGMLHLEQLIVIRDSLLNIDKSRSLMAMQIRYETQRKEQQILLLEQREEINRADIRNQRILIAALIFGLLFTIAIGTLAYINFRNARSSQRKIELLLSETRHRIKNNLQTLASIFNLQAHHYTDHNMIMEARSSESRVHAMSLLHEKFYSVGNDHTLETKSFVTDLVNQLVNIYGFGTRNLALKIRSDEVNLDIDKAVALGLIIHELVCNAFKYAFNNVVNPSLEIVVHLETNQEMVTTIKDNGVGLAETPRSGSHGLTLVNALVEQLNGTLETIKEKGTTFIIRFPVTTSWKEFVFS